ncbi:MAG TPA: MG2 domain-containing protein [Candidatus Obscuribacterales bacterium]
MSSTADRFPLKKNNPLLSWEFVILKLLLLSLLAVLLSKPVGSLSGRLALEQEGFNLYTYDMKQHHVYAIAIGPREGPSEERGVWVNKDGTFRIDNLPVGEYQLKVHVPGFATSYDSGIFVQEGKNTGLPRAVMLHLQEPNVSIPSYHRVFTTQDKPRVWVNLSGSSEAKLTVYKLEMLPLALSTTTNKDYGFEVSPEFNCYKPYDSHNKAKAQAFFDQQQVVRSWTRKITSDEYTHEEFQFEHPLPPGDYMAVAEAKNMQNKGDWNVAWFSVTDLGLIVKQDPTQTLVRAIDLRTLRPVNGADIKVLDRAGGDKPLAEGATDADGFAKLTAGKLGNGSDLIVMGTAGVLHAYGGLNYYSGDQSNAYKTMFYTERPVYRLGQTVYFKGICRKIDEGAMKNPGNLKLALHVEDPDNNKLWSGNLKTTDHGTFNGVFQIPEDGKTGAYQINIKYPNGSEDYERFEVAEYRKPEYQVDVIPGSTRITAGAKGKARVKATYYFGAPVANAKVKYTVFSGIDWTTRYALMDRPDYYAYFDGWDNEDSYVDGSYNGDYICEGYATTDANGEATVEFDTRKASFNMEKPWDYDRYDHKYRVEAEVTDISRLSVIGNGSLSVTNGDFEVFVKPDSYVAKVGEPISAEVRAVSYDDHKPLANQPVHLRLYRRVYDRVHYDYKGIEVFEDKVMSTDQDGKAKIIFATKPKYPTDTYEILATSEDSYRNIIADESSVWVVSDTSPYALEDKQANQEPLKVTLDKNVYRVGDTAKVMIVAPVTGKEGIQALVTVEGPKLYKYQLVDMKATATMVEIPILPEYAPNVYAAVTFVGKKRQFYQQSQMIKVSPKNHFLQVTIESDKPKYKPGETATYTVKAQFADGKPAPNTELSLGVVDESVYAVRPDTTADIRSFFYDKRGNSVTTICSFPEDYSGGPDKVEPRVRKDFKDTAVWIPTLVTDDQGIAHATVKLPDNLTTWRATAVGINMATEVGMARQKVIATQDLILRLALPRFFSQGDEGVITAVVHNYTDQRQSIDLTLNASGEFKVKQDLHQKLMVEPDKAKRYCWPVSVTGSGEAQISCKAVGATAGDAMQVKLPIRSLGVDAFIAKAGILTADEDTTTIPAQLPPDAMPGSGKLHVYLSSSTIGSMVGNFSSLIDYPYGCTEQTMSKLMPSVIAVRLSQTLGVPLSAADKAKFAKVYKLSMDKLNSYQHADGGWGWWESDNSQIYLTALVLDGYKQLKDAGYAVPADRSANGLAWLKSSCLALTKQLNDPLLMKQTYLEADKAIDLSRGLYVLSRYKQPVPPNARKWALARKDLMTPEPLAYFAMALQNSGDTETARAFYDRLNELANTTNSDGGASIDWSPSKQMFTKLGRKGDYYWYSYRYTDVETTALALQAMATFEPDNFDRIESVKRWILLQRDKDGWANTKTTAEVLRALMQVESHAAQAGGDTDFTASIDMPSVSPLSFTKLNALENEKDIILTPKSSGAYSLHKQGHGRLYYSTVLTYYKRIKPGEYVAQKSQPNGLKMSREFFRMVPSAPDSNGNVHFTAQPLADRTIKAGETILMKVTVDVPESLPYVILEAPLPSGAEVVQNDSRANAKEDGNNNDNNQEESPFSYNMWWTHQDVMDDHLAFFVTDFGRGKAEINQMVRMEIPGTFQMNPITLQGMYSKSVRAYSQADALKVVE